MVRLLLVDDDDVDAKHLQGVLGALVDVDHVRTGLEAWSALMGDELPHMLMIDVSLPGQDGRELARMMREDPRTAMMPVYTWSGEDAPDADLRRSQHSAVVEAVRDAADRARRPSVIMMLAERTSRLEIDMRSVREDVVTIRDRVLQPGLFRETCSHAKLAVRESYDAVVDHPWLTLSLATLIAVVVMTWGAVPESVRADVWNVVGIDWVAQRRE